MPGTRRAGWTRARGTVGGPWSAETSPAQVRYINPDHNDDDSVFSWQITLSWPGWSAGAWAAAKLILPEYSLR